MSNEILERFVYDPEWQRIQEILEDKINAKILWIRADSGDTIESLDENYHRLCEFIRNSPDGQKKCQNSHNARFLDARRMNSPILSTCHCGLICFAVPISIDSQIIGVIGGYIPNSDFPITVEKCAEISFVSNADIKDVMDCAKSINHITKAEQRQILSLLSLFAEMLSSLVKSINRSSLTDRIEDKYKSYIICLSEVYDLLKSNIDLTELLKIVSGKIRSAMRVDASSIYILDTASDELSLISTAGLPDSALGQKIKVGEGIVGYVAQNQDTLAIEDATLDPRALRIVTGVGAKRRTYRSVLSVPLMSYDKLVGVIDARTFEAKSWGQGEIDFLMLIAKHIANAISNYK